MHSLTHRGEGHGRMEAEIGAMLPQAKDCPELLGAGAERHGLAFSVISRSNQACQHLVFKLPASRTVGG